MIEGIKPTDQIKVELHLPSVDFNDQKKEALRQVIADKYGVGIRNVDIEFVPVVEDASGNRVLATAEIINNIQDPKFQQELFKDYLELKKIEDVDFDAIVDIDNQINASVDFESYSKYKSYKIKSLRWDNFLSYGKGNYFEFDNLNGLVLVNAENQQGKTTFCIDLIRFALFGKSDKAPTLDKVFNIYFPEETEVMVEAMLEIDREDYVIRRTITRPALNKRTEKTKPKQKVEFFKKVGDTMEVINYEAESSTQTNNVIKDAIGSIDDFNLIISANAYTLGDLVRLGESERGRTFSRWLGLLTLEEKEKLAKDFYKNKVYTTLQSRMYNKVTLQNEIDVHNENIKLSTEKKTKLEQDKSNIEKRVEGKNTEKENVLLQKRPVNEELVSIDVATVENNISNETNLMNRNIAMYNANIEKYNQLVSIVYDADAYRKCQEEVNVITSRNGELRAIITNYKSKIAEINNLISMNICPTCGQPINVAAKNDEIAAINALIDQFMQEGISNKAKLDKLNADIQSWEEKREKANECQKLNLMMATQRVQIDNSKLRIDSLTNTKKMIEDNKENIAFNNVINNKIRAIDNEIMVENRNKDVVIRDIYACDNDINNSNREIKVRQDMIAVLEKEEVIIRNWTIYNELVGKNGIVKLVLKKSLPIINNEIKRLLTGLCDFDVRFDITLDNKVDIALVRDNKPLDLSSGASGFEMTMASVAIRTALAMVSAIAKPNFVVYDEIIGTIHANNFETFKELMVRVSKQYQCILHITHAEDIFPIHNSVIRIVKENNMSKIYTGNGETI